MHPERRRPALYSGVQLAGPVFPPLTASGMDARIDPVTVALAKEARERLAELRELSADFKLEVCQAREILVEARHYLRRAQVARPRTFPASR